ncbi:MAG: hypothetical protein ABIU58_02870 [Ramlibacter sp.]
MGGSNDTKEDHGSAEHQSSNGREVNDGGHSGYGSASALERLHTQRLERHQDAKPDDAAGVHGQ